MKCAADWWDETKDHEGWIDNPAGLIEQIQLDAFAAGMTAARELAAKRAACAMEHLPQVAYYQARDLARLVRGIDIEMHLEAAFARALEQLREGESA